MAPKKNTHTVNPYDVEGEVDYNKLVTEFGIKKLTSADLKRIEKI